MGSKRRVLWCGINSSSVCDDKKGLNGFIDCIPALREGGLRVTCYVKRQCAYNNPVSVAYISVRTHPANVLNLLLPQGLWVVRTRERVCVLRVNRHVPQEEPRLSLGSFGNSAVHDQPGNHVLPQNSGDAQALQHGSRTPYPQTWRFSRLL